MGRNRVVHVRTPHCEGLDVEAETPGVGPPTMSSGSRTGLGSFCIPDDIVDRDGLIRFLVCIAGCTRQRVAKCFGISDRQVRRITSPKAMEADVPEPDSSSTLSRAELVAMANDLAQDPYTNAEEREEIWEFIQTGGARVA